MQMRTDCGARATNLSDLIASCNFPYAHGFAFISDLGARNLAMGYLGQVICTDRGSTAMGSGR